MPRPLRELQLPYGVPSDPVEAFALVVRERRLELGLTQSDLEDDASFDRSYVSKLELAKRTPDLLAIFHIAGKLKLEPNELLKRVEGKLAMKRKPLT
ncbi:MAG: helix-turn-helix transcriptional regulator [Candidatus Kapabacteria bacterium]|nr:helix-turn-helix transcriptional regulator [Candidatus Kapabacteria bacterium]